MTCPICDGRAVERSEVREVALGRRTVEVLDEFYRCEQCGEEFSTRDQTDEVQKRAAAQIREEEGLLQPADIREVRAKLGLSQAKFEQLLGVGPKTVVRWEKGTVFQNRSTDSLIRLIDADYRNVIRLANWHGISLEDRWVVNVVDALSHQVLELKRNLVRHLDTRPGAVELKVEGARVVSFAVKGHAPYPRQEQVASTWEPEDAGEFTPSGARIGSERALNA